MSVALREAFTALRRTPLLALLSMGLVALALYVPGVFGLVAWNLSAAIGDLESRVEVVAWLRDDAPEPAIELARAELGLQPEVAAVRYVSQDSALARARRTLPEFSDLLDGLAANPLPASLELELTEGLRTAGSVDRVAELVAAYPFVERVDYGREWVERIFELRRVAGVAALGLGGIFAFVAAVLLTLAMRISVYARRDEIRVMRLVGAHPATVQLPFLLSGVVTGLLGAIVAVAATRATFAVLDERFVDLRWIPAGWVVLGVLAGLAFGLVAAMAGVQRHMKEGL